MGTNKHRQKAGSQVNKSTERSIKVNEHDRGGNKYQMAKSMDPRPSRALMMQRDVTRSKKLT